MQRLQAFKFELIPNGLQERCMRRFAGSCRYVFNRALADQIAAYEADPNAKLSYSTWTSKLPAWKAETGWLKQAPSQALQQALKDLERAYQNFFAKRAKFPRFKKRGQPVSVRFPQGFKFDAANARIFLPKLGWMRLRLSRAVLGTPKSVTVSCVAGRWYASILTEREVAQSVPSACSAVGVDMGIARFATLSDGAFLAPLSSFKKHEVRLRRYQRAMSRKCKGSSNWRKAKAHVQRIHARIANVRQDFLHKASTQIASQHALVVVEDLRIKNMSASAKGDAQEHGKNVYAKSGLNKSILDQGWGEFRRQLEYKLNWNGGQFLAVNPINTSRECPECGHIHADNRKTQAVFCCVACGYKANADLVGAMNVLARGHRVLACGEDVSRVKSAKTKRAASVKQEPAEAINGALKALH